ncbi:MAG: peptidoglycan DD-metalloendopeptidase family protein [Scytolyngbya sp. HA4215-MV1]|nr:peptidoglycan DD-metalloendopeptidase family protein [Scytolyngbya sp. HA4215-MV1]
MKRTFPQKVTPFNSCQADGCVTGQTKQVSPEVNRRARTSAAVIGLAISMGAHSLLMPRQSDSAMAAEPVAPESTLAASTPVETATLFPGNDADSPAVGVSKSESIVVEHTVQEGQTIWQLAQVYRVSPAEIAAANGFSLDVVLRVGQTLSIPTQQPVSQPQAIASTAIEASSERSATSPDSHNAVDSAITAQASADAALALKAEQDAALVRLQQKRNVLKNSLANLKAGSIPADSQPFVDSRQQSDKVIEVSASQLAQALTPDSAVVAYHPSSSVGAIAPSLPTAPEVQVVGTEAASYQVKPGDTLDAIARRHGLSRSELAKLNRLSDPNFILVGQVLRLPTVEAQNLNAPVIPSLPRSTAPVSIASTVPIVAGLTAPAVSDNFVSTISAVASEERSAVSLPLQMGANANSQPDFQGVVAPPQPTESAVTIPVSAQTTSPASVVETPEAARVAAIPQNGVPVVQDALQQVIEPSSVPGQNRYVENLRTEIVKMREKLEAERSAAPQNTEVVAVAEPMAAQLAASEASPTDLPSASRLINPEFKPNQHLEALRTEVRGLKSQPVQAERQVSAVKMPERQLAPEVRQSQSAPQVVAVAPLGSESYEPILQSALGQMVSPELPPIGNAESYLPGSSAKFKGYIWPAKGLLTSGYGWRWGRMHKGIDIAAPIGTPVVAAAPGVVVTAGWNSGGYGNLVEIQHADGSLTLYAHNNRILVREGQKVDQGQQIAEMGSTGYSTGPHSHFEVHLPGQGAVNPIAYLPKGHRNS